MSSPLRCAFNVTIHLQQHHNSNEDQIWFSNSGGLGWVDAIGFSGQLLGVTDSAKRVYDYLANIGPVPANNDAENQAAADAFLPPLLADFSLDVLNSLFHKACVAGVAHLTCDVNGIGVSVVVKYQYPIFYCSKKYKATLDIGESIAVETTRPLTLAEVFSNFEQSGFNCNSLAYFLDESNKSIDSFVQYIHASEKEPTRRYTLAVL